MSKQNDNHSEEAGQAAPLVTLVYSVDHEVPDLLAIAEALRARSIVMLPSVGTSYAFSDASAWESPLEQVAIRTRTTGDYRPRTIMLPGEYTSLAEYTDALIRAILDEPEQCMAEGCTDSEDGGGSGYCSYECYARCEENDEDDSVDVEVVDIDAVRSMIHDGPLVDETDDEYTDRVEAAAKRLCDEVQRLRAALDEVADGRDEARAVFQRHMAAADGEIAALRDEVERVREMHAKGGA